MNITKIHTIISVLSFPALTVCLVLQNKWVSLILIATCLLVALAVLGSNVSFLSNIAENNAKSKTLRFILIFDSVCFLAVIALIILNITGRLVLTDNSESMIASAIVSIVILILGNICPQLPYSRYTGLRLPWTLADEPTWTLAHRILGYTAIPLGVCNLIVMFSFKSTEIRNGFGIGTFLLWIAIASFASFVFFYNKRVPKN